MSEAGNHTRVIHPQVWILLWISTCAPRFGGLGAPEGPVRRAYRIASNRGPASPDPGIHERDTRPGPEDDAFGARDQRSPKDPRPRSRTGSAARACDYRHLRVMRKPTIMMARPITMFHQEMLGIG